MTHLYNAMPGLHHRKPGVIPAALEAGATPEIIADGVHIHPAMVRLAFSMFGAERMILISDSMEATGMPDGEYSLGGQAVTKNGSHATLHDGTLAGSATDLMGCMKVAATEMGLPLEVSARCDGKPRTRDWRIRRARQSRRAQGCPTWCCSMPT